MATVDACVACASLSLSLTRAVRELTQALGSLARQICAQQCRPFPVYLAYQRERLRLPADPQPAQQRDCACTASQAYTVESLTADIMRPAAVPGAPHVEAALSQWSPAAEMDNWRSMRRSHPLYFMADPCLAPSYVRSFSVRHDMLVRKLQDVQIARWRTYLLYACCQACVLSSDLSCL